MKAVIFDCDGTLINSLGLALDSMNYALDQVGFPPRTPQEIKRFFGSSADRIFLGVLGGDKERALKAFHIYLDHQTTLASQTTLFPGIRELLDRLHRAGVPMAVVTGRHERDLEINFGPHQLHVYFQAMVTDNILPNSKPAPDGLLLACKRLGIEPKDCFYVGDSVMDLQAAHRAGAKAIAALWDELVIPEMMAAENPAVMAKVPNDVWVAFEKARASAR